MAFGWLAGRGLCAIFAGGVLTTATHVVGQQLALDISSQIIFAVLAVIAVGLSFIPRLFLIALTAIGVIAAFILANVNGNPATGMALDGSGV